MTRLTQGRVIGEGGMAIVYEGTRLTGFDHAPVAIKRLLDERKAEPEIVARFVQEGWLGLELAHKNLGKVYELDRDQSGDLRIVMEMVDGVALEDIDMVLRPHPRLIRTVLFALFDVVGYLHDCKVLHRDISPRNILISRAGMVKLIDLGLARDLDAPASEPGPFKGTAAFASPNTIRCEEFTAGSDVYSVGAIGYWLLTGQPPYGFGHHVEIAKRIDASQIAPLPDDVPADLRQVIMESLRAPDRCVPQLAWMMQDALDPGDEPLSPASDFADIVAPFLKRTVLKKKPTAGYQHKAGWKSRRTLSGFAAAMAGLLIVAAGWRFWLDSRPSGNGPAATQTATESRSDAPAAHEDIASEPAPEPAREPTEPHVIGIRHISTTSTTSTTDAEPPSPPPHRARRAARKPARPARMRVSGVEPAYEYLTPITVSGFAVFAGEQPARR